MTAGGPPMRGAIWLYPWDLLDEGVEAVLRRVRDEGGLSAVHLAVCYHAGLFLLPHNPRRKVYFPLDGAVYYQPDLSAHAGCLLQPLVHPMVDEGNPLRLAQDAAFRLGMQVAAWVVPTHNARLGLAHPDCVQVNAFGDPHYPSLCPAHLEVQAYAAAIVAGVARYDPAAIVVESLEYHPFEHGYHHEVHGIVLTPLASVLLALCFCESCLRYAAARGVDTGAVRHATREVLEGFFDGRGPATAPDFDAQLLLELSGGQMRGFLAAREFVVTDLWTKVAALVRRFWSGELARADLGLLRPGGAAARAFRAGANLTSLSGVVDRHDPAFYASDPAVIGGWWRDYRGEAPPDTRLMPALRAIRPQTESRESLIATVRACRDAGVDAVSFYNYSFMRLETLGWIREALAG